MKRPVVVGRCGLALAALLASVIPSALRAQDPLPRPEGLTALHEFARTTVSGGRARDMVAVMDPSYRVPGNQSFRAAIDWVIAGLREAGYVEASEDPGAHLTYWVEERNMGGPAWDPVSASVTLVGSGQPLMTLATNMNLLAAYSHSTPAGGVEAEVVDVGQGRAEDFERVDVRGKIVLGEGRPGSLFQRAVLGGGALGVMAFRLSSFNRPEVNRTIAPMSSIPYDAEAESWGLALSKEALDEIRGALAQGPARVRVEIASRIYPSVEPTLIAEVRGGTAPEERFVFSAHVQESGANDNATGVAAQAEVARALGEARQKGVYLPHRTVSMIWGDEITSTRRYLEADPDRAEGVIWGLSLDMVGEDTRKTGGTFLIEKLPDPSAVWTRGEDQHTEWGGRPMSLDEMVPHYLNDFTLQRCLDQARASGWVVKTNPYEGGSDHVPFLRAGIPGVLFWHFTDQYYHTDGDRLDMVSAETLANVSVSAAVIAMSLTSADSDLATYTVSEVTTAARDRLLLEEALSRQAIIDGGTAASEVEIIKAWTRWYVDALGTVADMEAGGPSPETWSAIQEAQAAVTAEGERIMEGLGGVPTLTDSARRTLSQGLNFLYLMR